MVAFGWSAGDIVASINPAIDVAKAFRETGGATSRYKQSQEFFDGFKVTLQHLQIYAEDNQDDTYIDDLKNQITRIEQPWKEFKNFLDKYDKFLGEDSQRSRIGKAPRKVKWALKDLSGEVEKLEKAISKPLQVMNSILSLHSL